MTVLERIKESSEDQIADLLTTVALTYMGNIARQATEDPETWQKTKEAFLAMLQSEASVSEGDS